MIGQENLISQLSNLIKDKKLPRFMLLVGQNGSGRTTLAHLIKDMTTFDLIEVGIKVDDIREMINQAYSIQQPMIYLISNADGMSEVAKNSMLKVCEEPPNNAYIIMTLLDTSNTLATIKSRAQVFNLETYTPSQLLDYYHNLGESGYEETILDVCNTPGQILDLLKLNPQEFMNYVGLVFDNIHKVSGSNAFKIGSKLNLEDDINKYPLDLFYKAFNTKCLKAFKDNPVMYAYGIRVTSRYLRDLRFNSMNKQYLFDCWLLEIRNGWLDYAESNT